MFDEHDDREPAQIVKLDAAANKTFFFWHVYVKGLRPGAHYAYRVDGPADLHGQGFRFNPNKVLIDPYAYGNTDALWNRADACGPNDNLASSMRSVVIDIADYDWEGDRPLNRPMNEMVIYEMHVGGFTRHPSSGVEHPGTFAGIIEKIPYLKELGITAVELLPVMEFDRKEVLRMKPDGSGPLTNYWGYSTVELLRAGIELLRLARAGGARPRVPRPGQGPAPRRHRGHSRHGLQPHQRGQPPGADDQLQGLLQRDRLPPRRRPTGSTTWTTRAAATR